MASEVKDDSLIGDTSMEKKRRKRQKKLMLDVCQQIEFYFSDANLRKDRFLKKEMEKNKDGYISVDVIASFNKILLMKADRKLVISAIQHSSLLELSEDGMLVRRKEALKPPRYDPDDCTVYVECLPKKTDHEWLKKAFSYCGKVVYVSLPRYKSTSDIKGFAFIEFECPDDADRACEVMNNPPPDMMFRPGKFPMMKGNKRIVPLEFDLSKQYPPRRAEQHSENRVNHGKGDDAKQIRGIGTERDCDSLKRKSDMDDGGVSEEQRRKRNIDAMEKKTESCASVEPGAQKVLKRKLAEDPREETVKKSMRKHTSSSESFDKDDDDREDRKRKILQQAKMHMMKRKRSLSEGDMWSVRENDEDSDSEREVKKSRRDERFHAKTEGSKEEESPEKKKRSRKKKMKRIQEEEEALFLRVIPKREWMQLKEEYLTLQKESLAQMKEARRGRYRMPERGNQTQPKIPEIDTIKTKVTSDASHTESKPTDFAFIAGTVMKLECLQPSVSRKEVKEHLQILSPVAYVDLPEGHTDGFVRFESAEGPKTVLEETNRANLASQHISLSLVSGTHEKAYWEKLSRDREIKLSSQQQKKKKKRGVNKNARKAGTTKEKTHIRFDE